MITEAQRIERINYLGASDAAAAVGLSRWKTMLELWAEKTGQVEPEDLSKDLRIRMGNKLEEVIAELFEEETGKKVRRANETIFHPKYPFLAANLDRVVVGEGVPLEIKAVGARAAHEWEGEEMPREVIIQVMHQLACTRKPYGYACALIGGTQDFKLNKIERDEAAIKQLEEKEVYFWNTFVMGKAMPDTISKDDGDILLKLFPEANKGTVVGLDDRADALIEGRQGMLADLANLKNLLEQQDNEIKALLKESEAGESSRYFVSWKNQTRKAYEVKESKFRTLKIKTKEVK